jgi:accessory colonization factor AcfC
MKVIILIVAIILVTVNNSGESVREYDAVEKEALQIVMCESGGKHDVWGDLDKPYPAYGIAQFQKRTFNYFKKLAGKPELKWKNQDDQLWLLRWAIRNGYSKHWTCASVNK